VKYAINTRRLDRMSVDGGGQVKPVLLGYTRYVLASCCAPRAASELSARAPSVPRIFIESGCRCYFRRRPDARSSSCLHACHHPAELWLAERRWARGMLWKVRDRALAISRSRARPDGRRFRHNLETQTVRKACIVLERWIGMEPDESVIFSELGNSFVGTVRKAKPPPWMSSRRRCKR
jgi:hypothetical protein